MQQSKWFCYKNKLDKFSFFFDKLITFFFAAKLLPKILTRWTKRKKIGTKRKFLGQNVKKWDKT